MHGKRHGWGRMEWHDGNFYEGTWSDDLVCPGLAGRNHGEPHFLRPGYQPSPVRVGRLRGASSAVMASAYRQRLQGAGAAARRGRPAPSVWGAGACRPQGVYRSESNR